MVGTFDVVLASHSLPNWEGNAPSTKEVFLRTAWECVSSTGVLILVTFKGSGGGIAFLRGEFNKGKAQSGELQEIIDVVSRVCNPILIRANSFATARSNAEMLDYCRAWLNVPNCGPEVAKLRNIVQWRYFVRKGFYVLPIEHIFIKCQSSFYAAAAI